MPVLVLLAVLATAITPSGDRRALWWALGAALGGSAVWTAIALVMPVSATGVAGLACSRRCSARPPTSPPT